MSDTPNLYGFATKELAQDATIAYILAWADPKYKQSHKCLHALGTELLRALLATQGRDLPQIERLCIKTQVERIDILVSINLQSDGNGIILVIEDKVSTQEHSNQIKRYMETAKKIYADRCVQIVAVYLKTGNESNESLPDEGKCGRLLRRDLLDVLNGFTDTGNLIVDDFRRHLQGWEDDTNSWRDVSYSCWTSRAIQGFYTALEKQWKNCRGWGYRSNPAGGFLACYGGFEKTRIKHCKADLYLQVHDAIQLKVRLYRGDMDKVRSTDMHQVLRVLQEVNQESSDDIQICKAGRFRGGEAASVANVTFDEQCAWMAVDAEGKVDLGECVDRLHRVHDLIAKVAAILIEDGLLENS